MAPSPTILTLYTRGQGWSREPELRFPCAEWGFLLLRGPGGPLLDRLLHFTAFLQEPGPRPGKHTCGETARFQAGGRRVQGVLDWLSRASEGMETPRHREGEEGGGVGLAERGWARSCVAGGRLVCLGRGAEILYSLAVAHARRWTGQPVPTLKLRPSDGRSAHTGALPAPWRNLGTAKEAVVVDYGVRWESLLFPIHSMPLPTIPSMRMHGWSVGLAYWGARSASRWTVSQWSPLPWSLSCPPSPTTALPCQPETGHHEQLTTWCWGTRRPTTLTQRCPSCRWWRPTPASCPRGLLVCGLGRELWCKGLALFPPFLG